MIMPICALQFRRQSVGLDLPYAQSEPVIMLPYKLTADGVEFLLVEGYLRSLLFMGADGNAELLAWVPDT